MASGLKNYDVSLDNGATVYATTTDTSLVVSGRTPGQTYQVRVRARDNAGNVSAWSAPISVTTSGAADTVSPTTPTGLGSSSVSFATATVSWSAASDNVGVTKYQVEVNGSVLADESTTLSRALTGLAPSSPQSVRVRAGDAAGNWSAWTSAHTFSTTAAPSGPSPLAAYAFDENAGTTAADAVGTRHLTVAAGNWATGNTGSGLTSAGGVVTIPSKAGLETAHRTLMFWAKYPNPGGVWRWPVEFLASGPNTATWGVIPITGAGDLYARIRIGGVNTNLTLAAGSSVYDQWHHYAITYDGTTFRLFRDGVQVGSQAVSGTIDAADTVRIHAYGGSNVVDDVRFYNTALTVTQIQEAMNDPV